MRAVAYDPVLHAQRHFRSILDGLARPGTICDLAPADCVPPGVLSIASALVGFALLDGDATFHLADMTESDAAFLTAHTGAEAVPVDQASFIFASGSAGGGILEGAYRGTLTYPDTSATLVVQVDGLSAEPRDRGMALSLEGPGTVGVGRVYVAGLSADLLLALQARNLEFPLGIDAILTATDHGDRIGRVLGIPRTSRLDWRA